MQTHAVDRRTATRRPLYVDVLLALAVGFVATLAKRYLDFSLGIPGHAGVGWIAALVLGRIVNPRRGMAALAGVSMGFWGVPLGLDHTVTYNTMLYGFSAGLLDMPLVTRLPLRRPWGAAVAGVIVHLGKYGFVLINAWVSGIVRRVVVFGLVAALGNHVLFGALGGVLGWAVWRSGSTLARRVRPPQRSLEPS
jgi:hypothetical protein